MKKRFQKSYSTYSKQFSELPEISVTLDHNPQMLNAVNSPISVNSIRGQPSKQIEDNKITQDELCNLKSIIQASANLDNQFSQDFVQQSLEFRRPIEYKSTTPYFNTKYMEERESKDSIGIMTTAQSPKENQVIEKKEENTFVKIKLFKPLEQNELEYLMRLGELYIECKVDRENVQIDQLKSQLSKSTLSVKSNLNSTKKEQTKTKLSVGVPLNTHKVSTSGRILYNQNVKSMKKQYGRQAFENEKENSNTNLSQNRKGSPVNLNKWSFKK